MIGDAKSDPLAHGLWQRSGRIENGFFHLTEAPGFGCDPDWDFVKAHAA